MRMRVDSPSNPPAEDADGTQPDPVSAAANAAHGRLSENTERALRSDLSLFSTWCAEHELTALPASVKTLAAFIDAMTKMRAPATVRRYMASIASAHRAIGAKDITASETVRRALKRMHYQNGRRQAQAEGLTWPLRKRLLMGAGDDLVDARNRALLAVAYDTLLRRSELVALEVADIVEELDGAATVLVRRSKTDREGRGAQVYLAPDSMRLLHDWLRRSKVTSGRVFRSLSRGIVGERLDAGQVSRIFKRMARNAGLPGEVVEQISGHSTRVGATQDMVAGGISMPAILHAGRWKTTAMVNRYGEGLLARRSGAAQLAQLQQRR